MELREDLTRLLETLKQERDELRVKMHLAKLEVQEEWEKAEKQWESFKAKAEKVLEDSREIAEELAESAKVVGEELKNAYVRIRQRLT
jgi:SMC interacting uncharacterized protein involved in chromosome segregation